MREYPTKLLSRQVPRFRRGLIHACRPYGQDTHARAPLRIKLNYTNQMVNGQIQLSNTLIIPSADFHSSSIMAITLGKSTGGMPIRSTRVSLGGDETS